MIVCSCNILRERDIRAAARRGCPDAETAYRSLGCQFQCFNCEDRAEEIVEEEREVLLSREGQAA